MPNANKIKAVKNNIAKMISQGATQPEIDLFVASEGLTLNDLKESKYTLERAGYQTLGGAVGGAVAAPGAVTTPIGVGLGSAFGGQVYDLKQELLGKKNPETLPERMKSAGEDFTLDVISPIAISKGIYGVKKGLGAVGSKARGVFEPAEYWVYKKFGIEPTAAMATRSKGLAGVEEGLSKFAVTSDIMQRGAEERIGQLTLANRFLANQYGEILSKQEIGTLLKKAAPNALEKYDVIYNKLFSRISLEIGEDPQPIKSTLKMLMTLVREAKTGPDSGVVELAKEIVGKAKNANGLPWESLKKYRSKIGDMMKSPELVSTRNMQQGDLKRLYGAMTDDMEAATLKAGAKTNARWRAANKYYETKLLNDIPILEDVIKKGLPEDVYDLVVMKSAHRGGTRLHTLRKDLTKKEWNAVAGTVLGKMGEETPGAGSTAEKIFSPRTFLTNWRKLSPQAKAALFNGTEYQPLKKELDQFVHIVSDMTAVEKMANVSNTGPIIAFYGLLSGLGLVGGAATYGLEGAASTAVGLGSMAIGSRKIAKLLTDPKFVKWLSGGVRIAKNNPNSLGTHLGRLMLLRFREDIQEEVDDVITGILGK